MPPIAQAIATAAAVIGSAIHCAHATPTVAATRLPPMIDQGCASGLAGTANSSTADAPIGATSSGTRPGTPGSSRIVTPTVAMPTSAPAHERRRSRQPRVIGWGMKLCNHCRNVRRDGEEPDDMDGKR